MYQPTLKSVALPVPEIIPIGVLGGVVTPNLGEEEAVGGRRWYHSKESSYTPQYLLLYLYAFQRYCRTTFLVSPTPPLVSPKISPFPLLL